MNFFLHFTSYFSDLLIDAFFGFREWLNINDFSEAKRRKRYLAEAPYSFEADGVPVVLEAKRKENPARWINGVIRNCQTSGQVNLYPINNRTLEKHQKNAA